MARILLHLFRGNVAYGIIDYISATHEEALDGTDQLDVETYDELQKYDTLIWTDEGGITHVHVVDEAQRTHDSMGAPIVSAHCISALASDFSSITLHAASDEPVTDDLQGAVSRVVDAAGLTSRWAIGTMPTMDVTWQPSTRSAWEELCDIASAAGVELSCLATTPTGMAMPTLYIEGALQRGNAASPYRISYTADMISMQRDVACDEIYTAVHAYGAEGVTCDVTDAQALQAWGIPGGGSTLLHRWGVYEDAEITDAQTLQSAASAWLADHAAPTVSYACSVAEIRGTLGDRVLVYDHEFLPGSEPLAIRARITRITRDLAGLRGGEITVGNQHTHLSDNASAIQRAVDAVDDGAMDDWTQHRTSDVWVSKDMHIRSNLDGLLLTAGDNLYDMQTEDPDITLAIDKTYGARLLITDEDALTVVANFESTGLEVRGAHGATDADGTQSGFHAASNSGGASVGGSYSTAAQRSAASQHPGDGFSGSVNTGGWWLQTWANSNIENIFSHLRWVNTHGGMEWTQNNGAQLYCNDGDLKFVCHYNGYVYTIYPAHPEDNTKVREV